MKKFKVLIVEDQEAEASFLKDVLTRCGHDVLSVATSLSEAHEHFSSIQPDISIVDIYLHGRPDGIIFAEELNEKGYTNKPLLFLTGANDTSTFRLAKTAKPSSYLLKPFNEFELQYAIELAVEQSTEAPKKMPSGEIGASDIAFVKKGNTMVRVRFDEIKYIEVNGKYSKIVCINEKFLVQQSLKDFGAMLPSQQFSRVHRNYIVNMKEVTKIDSSTNEIYFKTGNSLFFSRRYMDDFLKYCTLLK